MDNETDELAGLWLNDMGGVGGDKIGSCFGLVAGDVVDAVDAVDVVDADMFDHLCSFVKMPGDLVILQSNGLIS
jgi:hypothetical protein